MARLNLGDKLSLGGAFGLLHYHDYRPTDDVDAWWEPTATERDRQQVIGAIREALETVGQVRTRSWGDVVSIELLRGSKKKIFSFQIAWRSARLQPSRPAPWPGILLDSFPDLVANKMIALVERGAPRDFRDIYSLCQAGLMKTSDCWRLWRERQEAAGVEADPERARLAVESHLARIVRYRPLDTISDPQQRGVARDARTWYREELFDGSWIDGSLYPDTDTPEALESLEDRVDFLARLCAAWDFGILPELETVEEIRKPQWSDAVDACRLLTSISYHLLREWHGLPDLPFLGQKLPEIADDPNLAYI